MQKTALIRRFFYFGLGKEYIGNAKLYGKSSMHFRDALLTDASSLAAISMQVWVDTYLRKGVSKVFADYALSEFTTSKFEALIASDRENIIVSENEGGIDGFIRMTIESHAPVSGCSTTEISTLYVQPIHHGKGIGKRLLNEGLLRCASLNIDAVWLTVNSENTSALKFYEARSFQTVGQAHFRIGDDAYPNDVMQRRLA